VDGGSNYEYFIVKANLDIAAQIFDDKRDRVELVARSGWWWLYRNVERASRARYGQAAKNE
jgi:hypothetical protein